MSQKQLFYIFYLERAFPFHYVEKKNQDFKNVQSPKSFKGY